MKLIKYLLWLIIICLLGILVYQNLDYFMTTTVLQLDLKIESWNWTVPELQNGIYFAICFVLGLLLTGIKAIAIKYRLNKKIRTQDKEISRLKEETNTLKTELEVFKHDPYIKKTLVDSEHQITTGEKSADPGNEDEDPATQNDE